MSFALRKLLKEFSYERFIAFESNIEALTLVHSVIESPDEGLKIYINGMTGNGKTHLQHAAGLKWLKKYPKKKVVFADSGMFMRDCLYARNHKSSANFDMKYRDCDLLLIENIDRIASNDFCQTLLLSLFESIAARQGTIMVDSVSPLDQQSPIFSMQLVREIQNFKIATIAVLSDNELRFFIKVLQEQLKLRLSRSALEALVFYLSGRSNRVVYGCLNRIDAHIRSRELSINEVMNIISK